MRVLRHRKGTRCPSLEVMTRFGRQGRKERVDRHLEDYFQCQRIPQSWEPYALFVLAQAINRLHSHEVSHLFQCQTGFLPLKAELTGKFQRVSALSRNPVIWV